MESIVEKRAGAVVTLRDKCDGFAIIRPAAFVFKRTNGFGWLEPGYADPWGSPSPTWHEVEADITLLSATLIEFDGPKYSGDIEEYFGQTEVAQPMTWFEGWLNEQGITWAAERERIAQIGL